MINSTTNVKRPDEYWASLPSADLADEMVTRINRFTDSAEAYDLLARWRRSLRLTYGYDPDNDGKTWMPVITGSGGQIIRVRLNALLRFKRAAHVQVISQRPAPQARPSAYDSSATEAVPIANALCDLQVGKGGGERSMHLANWYCGDFGSGWLSVRWDELAGRKVPVMKEQPNPETGEIERVPEMELDEQGAPKLDPNGEPKRKTQPEGDVIIQAHRPDCVVFDVSLDDTGSHKWLMLATQRNRYELAHEIEQRLSKPSPGREPDRDPKRLRAHILGASSNTRLDKERAAIFRARFGDDWAQSADMVWVYELFHVQTSVLPEGRYAMLLDGIVLADGPNTYSELPLYEHCALRIQGTRWGYSPFFDLLGPQQVADAHITAATTTAENCGIPGVWIQPGGDQGGDVTVVEGLRLIKSMTEPKPVEFSGDAPQKLTASHNYMIQQMMTLSGITDATLGDVSSANSGKQAAMAQAAAMNNFSDVAASYVMMSEATYNGVIKRYRAFSSTTRIVQIAGRGRKWQAKRFTAKTLDGIDGIDVQMGAAILRTTAGVVDTANMLLEAQMITREEYMAMITNGRLEPAFDGVQRHEALIERENEMLMDGENPEVAPTDNPIEHIKRHRTVLDDTETRTNEAVVRALTEHLASHDQVWMETSLANPALLMALGIPLHPMAQQMQAAQVPSGDPNAQPADGSQPEAPAPNPGAGPSPAVSGGGVPPTGEDLPAPTADEGMVM